MRLSNIELKIRDKEFEAIENAIKPIERKVNRKLADEGLSNLVISVSGGMTSLDTITLVKSYA